METDIEIQNLGTLQRDLSALADKMTKKNLVAVLKPGAKQLQRAVKQRAPKRTGALRSSVKVKVGKGPETMPYATVMTTFPQPKSKKQKAKWTGYGWFVHNGVVNFGTKHNLRKGAHSEANRERALARGGYRIKPEPFVYDAFEANAQKVATEILQNIENML